VRRFTECETAFAIEESQNKFFSKIFDPKKQIISTFFPELGYTENLWNYLKAIRHIHNLRRLNTLVGVGAVVGAHNSGKSSFLKEAFGFQTNPGLIRDRRTEVPTPYPLTSIENVLLVDFPGTDEIVIKKDQIKFMMEACNCWIIVSTYEHGFTTHIGELIALSLKRRIPCLLCLNKSDVVWKDCAQQKRRELRGKGLSKEELTKEIAVHFGQQSRAILTDYTRNAPTTTIWFTSFNKRSFKSIITANEDNELVKDTAKVKKWMAQQIVPNQVDNFMQVKLESTSESDDSYD